MSSWAWAGLLLVLATGLGLGISLIRLSIKNKELKGIVDKSMHELALLRDSQQGLGLQLLALERELHRLLQLQASPADTASTGTLNQIASRLRAGAQHDDIVAALGVSDAEVKLVQMIVAKVDQPPVESAGVASNPGEPVT